MMIDNKICGDVVMTTGLLPILPCDKTLIMEEETKYCFPFSRMIRGCSL